MNAFKTPRPVPPKKVKVGIPINFPQEDNVRSPDRKLPPKLKKAEVPIPEQSRMPARPKASQPPGYRIELTPEGQIKAANGEIPTASELEAAEKRYREAFHEKARIEKILQNAGALPKPRHAFMPLTDPPESVRLCDFATPKPDDVAELLRHRFLCRGGGLLLVGPTGIGKSAFVMQCMMQWAAGQTAFGIEPCKPLKAVLIQAENDEGDIAEFRDGIIRGLGLSESDAQVATGNIVVCTNANKGGLDFCDDVVKPLLQEHRPDLIIIDPALAYLGGETNSQKDVGEFLRLGLNPLIREYGAGAIIVHHTNKPPRGKEKADWAGSELSYLGSGSGEWANWARAIVAIRATGDADGVTGKPVFELCSPKRGGRLRWEDPSGNITFSRTISHSREAGTICWHEIDESDVVSSTPNAAAKSHEEWADLIQTFLGGYESFEKSSLIGLGLGGMGQKKARDVIKRMLAEEILVEVRIKRPNARDQINLALNNGTFKK